MYTSVRKANKKAESEATRKMNDFVLHEEWTL